MMLFDKKIQQEGSAELFKTSPRRWWAGLEGADEMASHLVGKKIECMVVIERKQWEREKYWEKRGKDWEESTETWRAGSF